MEIRKKEIENDGINPCPLCGSYKSMSITSESSFYEAKGRNGFCLILLECNSCNLQMWSHKCNSVSYKVHKDFLARRWNKLGAKSTDIDEERRSK